MQRTPSLRSLQDRLAAALLKLMANEKTQPLVNRALLLYQKGLANLSNLTEETLRALGFATKSELSALEHRIYKLEKRIEELGKGSPHPS